jgi:phosphoribosylformimino-5-aminoimidazole carboxamide ribotide isomerase
MEVQVGGGLRDMDKVERVMQAGATRVVVGTRALTDPAFLDQLVAKYGDKVIVGLDALDGKVRTEGWTQGDGEDYLAAGRRLQKAGVKHLLYTCISRDGTMTGPDVLGTVDLARSSRLPVIASGGVSSLSDLTQLGSVASQGISGVVVGKALLEGRFTVAQALARLRGED